MLYFSNIRFAEQPLAMPTAECGKKKTKKNHEKTNNESMKVRKFDLIDVASPRVNVMPSASLRNKKE